MFSTFFAQLLIISKPYTIHTNRQIIFSWTMVISIITFFNSAQIFTAIITVEIMYSPFNYL